MIILIVLLVLLIIALTTYIFLLRKEVRSVSSQIRQILEMDTNKLLVSDISDTSTIELIQLLNTNLEKRKLIQYDEEQKNRKLQEMILNMSHDLRTPLTSIQGYLQMLSITDIPNDKKKQYLQIVNDKTVVLKQLIDAFFELSKVEAEEYILDLEPINIYPILTDVLAGYYYDFEENNISLHVNLASDLEIMGHRESLERIFQNLLDNSVKHQSKTAIIEAVVEDEQVKISFSSEAFNLLEEDVLAIFDKFYTFSKNRGNRHGIGMAIVKTLVTKMHGQIQAEYTNSYLVITLDFPKCEEL